MTVSNATNPARRAPTPAEAYREYFGPAIFEPLTDHLVPRARPTTGERVLDLACGTGIVTRRLAAAVGAMGRVAGVDLNPAMLEVARAIPFSARAGIEWREGDGSDTGLPDGAFDLVTCQQGLQFFPDRAGGVAEMHRVLAGDGRVALALWRGPEHHPLYEALADAEEPRLRSLGADVTREDLERPFSLGDPGTVRALLADAGFREIRIDEVTVEARFPEPERFVERLEYAYAAVVPQFAEDPVAFARYLEEIAADTRDLVAIYHRDDHVIVPMHALIVTARR
jgi:ubiquinone/menaquinone biosynthesis C-methylase UbiE